jgi:hypothetical protein
MDEYPLHEQICTFIIANQFVLDTADFSRAMGRSRSYMASLRWSNKEPSPQSYNNLKNFLQKCLTDTDDKDLKNCLNTFINEINEVL